jgi:hypothetical protein
MIEFPTKGAVHQALPFSATTEAVSVCQLLPWWSSSAPNRATWGVRDHRDCYRVTCAESAGSISHRTYCAVALDRNELGALLVAAGLGSPAEHAT